MQQPAAAAAHRRVGQHGDRLELADGLGDGGIGLLGGHSAVTPQAGVIGPAHPAADVGLKLACSSRVAAGSVLQVLGTRLCWRVTAAARVDTARPCSPTWHGEAQLLGGLGGGGSRGLGRDDRLAQHDALHGVPGPQACSLKERGGGRQLQSCTTVPRFNPSPRGWCATAGCASLGVVYDVRCSRGRSPAACLEARACFCCIIILIDWRGACRQYAGDCRLRAWGMAAAGIPPRARCTFTTWLPLA